MDSVYSVFEVEKDISYSGECGRGKWAERRLLIARRLSLGHYIVDIAVSVQAPQHEAEVGVAYLISHPGHHPNYK